MVPSRITYAHDYQLDYKYRNPSVYHRSLGPDECPEFVYDPGAYDKAKLWTCLRCWRSKDRLYLRLGFIKLSVLKQHVRVKRVLSGLIIIHTLPILFSVDMGRVNAPVEGADYVYYKRRRPPRFVRVDRGPISANNHTP